MNRTRMRNSLFLTFFLLTLGVAASLMTVQADESQHEHQWEEIAHTEPTCEDYGEYTRRCLLCGTEETGVIPRLGHRLDVPENDSYVFLDDTDYRYCSRCEKRIPFKRNSPFNPPIEQPKPPSEATTQAELSPREKELYGHDPFTVDEYLEWLESIRNNGFYSTIAVVTYEDENSESHPDGKHVFPFLPADATCTTWGHFVYLACPYCGLSYNSATGNAEFGYYPDAPPTRHDYSLTCYYEGEAPTCTEAGILTIECRNGCGATLKESVPAMGHTYRYEKAYPSDDGRALPENVSCEVCHEEFHPTIAGYVWKDSRGAQGKGAMPKDKFQVTFTSESGQKYDAEYLDAFYFGYFADLPSGRYTMTVTAEGYEALTYAVTVEKGSILDFDVYLDGSGKAPDDKSGKNTDDPENDKNTETPGNSKDAEETGNSKPTTFSDSDEEEKSNTGLLIAIAAAGAIIAGAVATIVIRKRR